MGNSRQSKEGSARENLKDPRHFTGIGIVGDRGKMQKALVVADHVAVICRRQM